MNLVQCRSVEELEIAIDQQSPDVLYRGQSSEYLDADGVPSILTSFDRHGCIPNRMQKWYHYSRVLLSTFVKNFDPESDAATDQAILQHYGWRSFFVDASSSPFVAAWFASNIYKCKQSIELCEDYWEDPVAKIREYARYEPAQGDGVIYAISRKLLRARAINSVDLVEIAIADGTPRFLAQSAFMIGPLRGPLPEDVIVSSIHAPASVMAQYAAGVADMTFESLFPRAELDPVLAALTSLPWVKRQTPVPPGVDFFDRGLPLPEYYDDFVKIGRPQTAFYRRYWLADLVDVEAGTDPPRYFLTSESLYHGVASEPSLLPLLAKLVREARQVVIEIDGLIYFPYGSPAYGKGIFLRQEDDGTILLSELLIQQEGGRPRDFGIARGIFYRVDSEGRWTRVPHPEECDCGHVQHHHHHLIVAKHFEHAWSEGRFRQVRANMFADIDVDPSTDPWILNLKSTNED